MIRAVTAEQKNTISQIIRIEAEAFGDGGLSEWTLVPVIRHGRVFVLEEEGRVLGAIEYMLEWNNHARAYIIGLAIARESRGIGCGTDLMGGSINILAREGIECFELTVDPANLAAIYLYERKLGFVRTGLYADEYGPGINRIAMEKRVSQKE